MYLQRNEDSEESAKAFQYITIVPLNFITEVDESQEQANAFQVSLEEELALFIASSPQARPLALCCARLGDLLNST